MPASFTHDQQMGTTQAFLRVAPPPGYGRRGDRDPIRPLEALRERLVLAHRRRSHRGDRPLFDFAAPHAGMLMLRMIIILIYTFEVFQARIR